MAVTACRTTEKDKAGEASEVTPVRSYAGKIALVKAELKYVVVDGELGELPPAGTILAVYRGENKVGEVKVSQQARANNYAADIVSGTPQVGDSVRGN